MRMHAVFSRWKSGGAGTVTLGSDAVPNAAQGADGVAPGVAPPNTQSKAGAVGTGQVGDNALIARFSATNGFPVNRVAVAYNYIGAGSPVTLTADLYLWCSAMQRWFKVSTGTLVNGQITLFQCVALSEPVARATASVPASGSIEALLIVADNTAPNGEHRFAMGADVAAF